MERLPARSMMDYWKNKNDGYRDIAQFLKYK